MLAKLLPIMIVSGLFAAPKPATLTFHKDVAPILQARCQGCHRAGEAAPMALLTYQDARPWAKAIREAVATRKMPPWHADTPHGAFLNDRRLPEAERNTLMAWVDGGAPEGNAADAPPPIRFADGWTIGKPDAVIGMGADHKVPATGTVDYTWFVVPSGFTEDKWVEKVELRPGARSVVHHIVLFVRPPGSQFMSQAKPGVPFYPPKGKKPEAADTGRGSFNSLGASNEMISVYVPGGDAYVTRPGQARLVKAGSDLLFQMHYTANGKEMVDHSKVGFVFAKQSPQQRVVNTFIMNPLLKIPPGAPEHEVHARVTVHTDVELLNFFPHMHVRGKKFEYRVKYPDGRTEVLLSVPRYDFNWQMTYTLKDPLRLPAGTEIDGVAWYDNSPNNKFNPDPTAEVTWGDQTWEEMLAGFVDFAIPLDVAPTSISRPKPQTQPAAGQ